MQRFRNSEKTQDPGMHRGKRKRLILLSVLAVALAGLFFLVRAGVDYYGGIAEAERLKSLHEYAQATAPSEVSLPSDTGKPVPAGAAGQVDLPAANETVLAKKEFLSDYASLLEINPEVIGWIQLEDTRIDYPMLQHNDNEYYLHHSIENKKSARGCVYIDYRNSSELTDPNTLIYAHNMKDGSMFHALVSYKKKDFFESHRTFRINTLYEEGLWEVFSVYVVDADKETIDIDYSREGSFMSALEGFQKRSLYKTDTVLNSSDRIVTLVTCSYETSNSRTIVHARYIGKASGE